MRIHKILIGRLFIQVIENPRQRRRWLAWLRACTLGLCVSWLSLTAAKRQAAIHRDEKDSRWLPAAHYGRRFVFFHKA